MSHSVPTDPHAARRLSAAEHVARGRQLWSRFGEQSFEQAAAHYREAIALDPAYARAHAALGSIHAFLYIAHGRQRVAG